MKKNVVSLRNRTSSTDSRNDRDHSDVGCVWSDEQRGFISVSNHDITHSITEKKQG